MNTLAETVSYKDQIRIFTATNLFYHKAGGVTANEDAPLTVEAVYSGDNC